MKSSEKYRRFPPTDGASVFYFLETGKLKERTLESLLVDSLASCELLVYSNAP